MDSVLLIAHSIVNAVLPFCLLAWLVVIGFRYGFRPWWLFVLCVLSIALYASFSIDYARLVWGCVHRDTASYSRTIFMIDTAIANGKAGGFPWPFVWQVRDLSIWFLLELGLVALFRFLPIRSLRTRGK